jgi:hypothetical protein
MCARLLDWRGDLVADSKLEHMKWITVLLPSPNCDRVRPHT